MKTALLRTIGCIAAITLVYSSIASSFSTFSVPENIARDATVIKHSVELPADNSGFRPVGRLISSRSRQSFKFAPATSGTSYTVSNLSSPASVPFVAPLSATDAPVNVFTVPAGVNSIVVKAVGAAGGAAGTIAGGRGALLRQKYSVNPGDVLYIVVGQKGGDVEGDQTIGGGGGGGTFVYRLVSGVPTLLIAAGGGGGAGSDYDYAPSLGFGDGIDNSIDGNTGSTGYPITSGYYGLRNPENGGGYGVGGVSGSGGANSYSDYGLSAAGGSGWNASPAESAEPDPGNPVYTGTYHGRSINDNGGALGGISGFGSGNGGYGGGGSTVSAGGGGGGGYSGGGGGALNTISFLSTHGGGGGSYFGAGTLLDKGHGNSGEDGYATIEWDVVEIDITGNAASVADGDTTPSLTDNTDFGSTPTGVAVAKTFVVNNLGHAGSAGTGYSGILTTSGSVVISGPDAAMFTVTQQPATSLSPAGTSNFIISFNPTSAGLKTAMISLVNNDYDENPYDFSIQGTGTSTSTPLLPGTIGSDQTICLNDPVNPITNNTGASGGTGTINYQWQASTDNVNFTNIAAATAQSYSPAALTQTTYFRRAVSTATDAAVYSNTVRVTVNPLPTVTAGSNSPVCQNGVINLSSSAAVSYFWSGPGGFSNTSQNPTITNAQSAASGTYSVKVTDANGCRNGANVVVVVNGTPSVSFTKTDVSCFGGNNGAIDLTVSGGSAAYTYAWSNGAATEDLSGLTAGTYNVTVSSAGCQATASITISQPANAVSASASVNNASCSTSHDGSINVTATGGTAGYTYSIDGVNYQPSNIFNGLAAGSYSILVKDQKGCTATVSVNIGAGASPSVLINTNGPTSFCQGGNVVLTANTAPGLNYSWSPGGSTANSITASASGTYTLTGTNAAGCSGTASVTVTVNPYPAAPVISGPASACVGQTITLSASGAANYQWNNPGSNNSSITVTYDPSSVGTVSYNVSTTVNGCTATSAPFAVTVNALPQITGPTSVCQGKTIQLSGTGTPAAVNAWTSANPAIASVDNSGLVTGVGNAGTAAITYTNSNGCSSTVLVLVNGLPGVGILAQGSTTICQGQSVALNANTENGLTYSWAPGGSTASSITVNQTGTYTLTGTNPATGCSSSASIMVTVNPNPSRPTISGSTSVCEGGTVVLTSTPAAFYQWNYGPGTQSVSNSYNLAGNYTYSVTITDNNNCTATSDPFTVTVNASPTISGPSSVCKGKSIQLTGSGTPAASNAWTSSDPSLATVDNNGLVTAVGNGGMVAITYTNSNGCSQTVMIMTNALPAVAINPNGPVAICQGSSITLTANTQPGLTYSWSPGGSSGSSITVNQAGTYTLTGTSISNGCSNSASIVVTVNPNPVKPTITGENQICSGNGTTLASSSATGNHWNTGSNNQSITVFSAGTYSVTVTDGNGCQATSDPFTVTVNQRANVFGVTGGGSYCQGGNGVSISLGNSQTGFSYSLFLNGNTNVTTLAGTGGPLTFNNVTAAGNYTVVGTNNVYGCTTPMSGSVNVTINPVPTISGITGNLTVCSGLNTTLTAASGAVSPVFSWFNVPSGGSPISGSATLNTGTLTATTTYYAQVSSQGCTSARTAATVTVNPLPSPISYSTVDNCNGSVTITATNLAGGNSILWNTGAAINPITVFAAGTYSATQTNSFGCKSPNTFINLNTIKVPPAVFTVTGGGAYCTNNNPNGNITLSGSETGVNYQLRKNGSFMANIGGTGAALNFNGLPAGVYDIIAFRSGCTTMMTGSATVIANTPPVVAPVTASGNQVCLGGTIQLSDITPGGVWMSNNPALLSINATGLATGVTLGKDTVGYKVTDGNGCSNGAAYILTVVSTPTAAVTADGPTTFCPGGSVKLTASAGDSWLWSNGATTQSISVNESGSYSVTVTAGICSAASAPVGVTVEDVIAPVVPVLPDVTGECDATVPVAIATDNCAGTVMGTTSDPLSYSTQGNYVIHWTFTDPSGNKSFATQNVIVKDVIPPTVGCPDNITVPANVSEDSVYGAHVSFSATGADNCGVPALSYSVPSGSFFPIGTHTITVTADDGHGNKSQCSFNITVECVKPTILTSATDVAAVTDPGTCGANVTYTTNFNPGLPAAAINYSFSGATTGSGSGTGSGSVFNTGVTLVTVTASNDCGSVSCSFNVTVKDTERPVIIAPPSITVPANSNCQATGVNLGQPHATDNCAIDKISNDATGIFPLGTTTVTWIAYDVNGNSNTATQTVTVVDDTKPNLACPADIVLDANTVEQGVAGVHTRYTATATDNCSAATISYSVQPGSFFAIGSTTVTVSATDAAGNVSTCEFHVIVNCIKPVINTCPSDIETVTDAGTCGAVVNYYPSFNLGLPVANINYSFSGATTGSGAGTGSGAVFNTGVTSVTVTASSDCGSAVCSFRVTVKDNEKPNITAPAAITVSAGANCQATITDLGRAIVNDNCAVDKITNNSTGVFPLGTTMVTWTVYDVNGNFNTASQAVTVVDDTKPVLVCPADVVLTANAVEGGIAGAHTGYNAVAQDNCSIPVVTYSIMPGSFFAIGTTKVTVTATDAAGNISTCDFNVVVNCAKPAIVSCPGNMVKNTDLNKCSAVVAYDPVFNVGLPMAGITYAFSGATSGNGTGTGSGSVFNKGVTTVTVTATNICGAVSCNFTITVEDHQDPVITAPNPVTVYAGTGCQVSGISLGTPVTSDNCGGETYTNDAPATYSVGTTIVKWTVRDLSGNYNTATQEVKVLDTTRPNIVCPVDINVSASGVLNGQAGAYVNYNTTATDNCGIASISYSVNPGSFFALGTTTVTVTATDVNGNISKCTFKVTLGCVTLTPTVSSVLTSNIFTGAPATSLFIGYGAQSTVLQVSGLPAGTYSYAWSGTAVNRLSSTTSASPTFTPAAAGSYTFTVTVTNSNGCKGTASITICVTDIRVLSDNDKDDDQKMCDHQAHDSDECPHKGHKHYCDHRSHSKYSCAHRNTNDRDDDDEQDCDHKAHSASDCSHKGHNHTACNHKAHSANNCEHDKANDSTVQKVCDHKSHSASDCSHYGHHHEACSHKSHSAADCPHESQNGGKSDDNYKVYICHVPPGNTGKTITLSISVNAVAAHLANHSNDRLGSCDQAPCSGAIDAPDTIKPVINVPANITIGCGASTLPAATGTATATDNSGTATVTYSDVTADNKITRTWKAIDPSGNYVTGIQIITIAVPFNPVVISTPNSNVNTGGVSTNLYIGYGATATTLSAGSNLPSSGAPYTFSWSSTALGNCIGGANSSSLLFTPVAGGSYTFNVVVTNKYGCSVKQSIAICVKDIRERDRYGNLTNSGKVYVCHLPPGNPSNVQTICISVNAVPAHVPLHGGDMLGSCDQTCGTEVINKPPVMTCPGNITVSCTSATAPANCGTPSAVDRSGKPAVVTYSDAVNGNVITRTWTATDAAGNFTTCDQVITVIDNVKPVINCPGDKVVGCGSSTLPAATGFATATDNCSAVTVTYSDATAANGAIARTWVATDASGNTATCVQTITKTVGVPCVLPYPYVDINYPRTSVTFNESEILRAIEPGANAVCGVTPTAIKVWYNDEHPIVLGVRQVIVKTKSGTTTTNYPVSAYSGIASSVTNPAIGAVGDNTSDFSGNDVAAAGGRPLRPVLYISDITSDPNNRAGDWQHNGTAYNPDRISGSWKSAVRVVDKTRTPAVVTITPDADPAIRNNWNTGVGGDIVPSGLVNEGYGAEVVWNISSLGLTPGHTYRVQVIVHDGDQNKIGGDAGQACTTIYIPTNTALTTVVTGTTQKATTETAVTKTTEEELKVSVAPNPSTTYFTLKLESRSAIPVNLRVMDARGRVVDAKSKLGANSTIQVGHGYSSGIYYAEFIQGGTRKVVQLIKGKG